MPFNVRHPYPQETTDVCRHHALLTPFRLVYVLPVLLDRIDNAFSSSRRNPNSTRRFLRTANSSTGWPSNRIDNHDPSSQPAAGLVGIALVVAQAGTCRRAQEVAAAGSPEEGLGCSSLAAT